MEVDLGEMHQRFEAARNACTALCNANKARQRTRKADQEALQTLGLAEREYTKATKELARFLQSSGFGDIAEVLPEGTP